jgi:hypothetical protein
VQGPLELLGALRNSQGAFEAKAPPPPPRCSWLLLAAPGSSWLLLVPSGSSWPLLSEEEAYQGAREAQGAREPGKQNARELGIQELPGPLWFRV